MDQNQYKIWVAQLHTLDAMQLRDISSRINLLSKSSTKAHDGKQEFGIRVLEAISSVMKKNNADAASVTTLRKSAAYASAREKVQDLQIYFEKISKSKLVQDQVLKESVGLLYYDLLSWQGVAVSCHTLLQQIHRIPAVLNRAFPNYAASGLLSKIVKK